jgi:hypothetical protein
MRGESSSGNAIRSVQTLLGHVRLDTTLIYTHVMAQPGIGGTQPAGWATLRGGGSHAARWNPRVPLACTPAEGIFIPRRMPPFRTPSRPGRCQPRLPSLRRP